MIQRYLLLILLGLAAFVLSSCGDNDGAIPPEYRDVGTISGLVIDVSTEEPIEGATVTMRSVPFAASGMVGGVVERTTVTDENGFFFRGDVPYGEVEIKVTKSGYRTPPSQKWALTPGGLGDLLFYMAPGEDPPEKFEDTDEQEAWPPNYQP